MDLAHLDDRVHMSPCLLDVLGKNDRIPDSLQSPEYGTPDSLVVNDATGIRTLNPGIHASQDK